MSNVATLKDRARTLEQRGQWNEALALYREITSGNDGEEREIAVWNRIGDIHLRLGQPEQATEAYGQAVDGYAEAGLLNIAIALCKKILRASPGDPDTLLKLGKANAAQGFLVDARQSFLDYAEAMQRAGDLDAAFAALAEFAALSPEDIEMRRLLAQQLSTHGRVREAVEQWAGIRALLLGQGRAADAAAAEREILVLDPDADLAVPSRDTWVDPERDTEVDVGVPEIAAAASTDDGWTREVGPLDGLETTEAKAAGETWGEIPLLDGLEATAQENRKHDAVPSELERSDFAESEPGFAEPEDEEEDSLEPLPLLDVGPWDPEPAPPADAAGALRAAVEREPGDIAARHALVAELRATGRGEEAAELLREVVDALAGRHAYADALLAIGDLLLVVPGDVRLLQRQVEFAIRSGVREQIVRTCLELAGGLDALGKAEQSRAVYRRVLEIEPGNAAARAALSAPAHDYVDLASLLRDDEPDARSTRFVVEAEPPSGDEERDFAEMLSTFREKVAENIGTEDSASHYDLGLAFMEMGLLDEAISEFQVALRGGANPLATLEVLGRCFSEKGQPGVAVRVLERAVGLPNAADNELIGVLYELAVAAERAGKRDQALGYLERVLAVDIGFRDAGQRVAALRKDRVL